MKSASTHDRFPTLDGLRGLAAVGVFLCHFGPTPSAAPNGWLAPFALVCDLGWVGVDLFFVLSGFLITGILTAHRDASNYFSAFYAHRALRIFPLYFLLIAVFLIVLRRWLPNFFWGFTLHGAGWPYWLFASNLLVLQDHIGMLYNRPLAVTWSLAVEEQFYIAWALVVRFIGRAGLWGVAFGCLVGCVALRCYLLTLPAQTAAGTPSLIFRGAHFDGLCLGAMLRLAYDHPGWYPYVRRFGGTTIAWALLLLGIVLVDGHLNPAVSSSYRPIMLRAGLTALSIFFAALIAHGITRDTRLRRCLDAWPMQRLGLYSYFIYLFHWPISVTVARLLDGIGIDRLHPGRRALQLYHNREAATLAEAVLPLRFTSRCTSKRHEACSAADYRSASAVTWTPRVSLMPLPAFVTVLIRKPVAVMC